LEHGDLDYFKIRAIESKELLNLSKKKAGNVTNLSINEKRILKSLDGQRLSMDRNLPLLKSLLSLVEVDLRDEESGTQRDDETSENEIKSISFKNISIKN